MSCSRLLNKGSFHWVVSCNCRGLSCSKWCPPWCMGLCLSWKMNRLLLAAMAMMLSVGCHAVCRIFFLKSRLSTLISFSLLFFPTQTRRGLSTARRLHTSRLASRVTSRRLARSNIRKKLLYAPVMMTLKKGQGGRNEEMIVIILAQSWKARGHSLTCRFHSRHIQTYQRCSRSHKGHIV